jgi:hypothetical protein
MNARSHCHWRHRTAAHLPVVVIAAGVEIATN